MRRIPHAPRLCAPIVALDDDWESDNDAARPSPHAGRRNGHRLLAREDSQQVLPRVMNEAFRQGARGPAHDYTLEVRPWGVPLERSKYRWRSGTETTTAWCPRSRAESSPGPPLAEKHFVKRAGHHLWFTSHAKAIMRSTFDHR
jgi:hypothetical protein